MGNKKNKIEKKLQKLQDQYKNIEDEGYSLQEKGKELVKIGIQGKRSCEYLLNSLPIIYELSEKNSSMEISLSELEVKIDYELNENKQVGEVLDRASHDLNFIIPTATSTSASTSTDSMIVDSTLNLLRFYYPAVEIKKPDFLDTSDLENDLDNELNKIDASLSKRRKGAWDTIYSSSNDKIAQATHSMREVFAKIISQFASNENVKKADWWEKVPKTKDGVSLRQRIRYLLFGPKEKIVNDAEIKVIETNVNNCFNVDRFLKEIAHGSEKATQALVESKLKSMEGTILHILKSKNKYSK